MTIKTWNHIFNIGLWTIIGIIVSLTLTFSENLYYKYYPINNFIYFQRLDFQDYKKGSNIQILYSYRDSKSDTIGDFIYKVYCNGIGDPDWSYSTPGIILDKTEGFIIKTIQMPIKINLPVGDCEIKANIKINIKGYDRYIYLSDKFKVF